MSVEIVEGEYYSVLICNTSDTAFGPLFHTGEDNVEQFLEWLSPDPRTLSDSDLESKVHEWRELPKCGYCEKREADLKWVAHKQKHMDNCCEECYDLFVDEDEE